MLLFSVGMRAHVFQYFSVCTVAKTRPTVCLDGERARTRVCVCGPGGRRDAHARSSHSPCDRKYFVDTEERGVGMGHRGGGEGMRARGALRLRLRRPFGEGCAPDYTGGGGPVCLDARHADHPSAPKHHSTHHPANAAAAPYRHRPTPNGSKNRVHHRRIDVRPFYPTTMYTYNNIIIMLSSSTSSTYFIRTMIAKPPPPPPPPSRWQTCGRPRRRRRLTYRSRAIHRRVFCRIINYNILHTVLLL